MRPLPSLLFLPPPITSDLPSGISSFHLKFNLSTAVRGLLGARPLSFENVFISVLEMLKDSFISCLSLGIFFQHIAVSKPLSPGLHCDCSGVTFASMLTFGFGFGVLSPLLLLTLLEIWLLETAR